MRTSTVHGISYAKPGQPLAGDQNRTETILYSHASQPPFSSPSSHLRPKVFISLSRQWERPVEREKKKRENARTTKSTITTTFIKDYPIDCFTTSTPTANPITASSPVYVHNVNDYNGCHYHHYHDHHYGN